MITQDYHKFVNDGSFYAHTNKRDAGEFSYVTLGIAGEAGEVADVVKKIVRDAGYLNQEAFARCFGERGVELLDECSDVLWYLTRMCTLLGISIESLMIYNTKKLYDRHYPRGTDKEIPWPLRDVSYDDASRLMPHIEFRITQASVLTYTDTDMSSRPIV